MDKRAGRKNESNHKRGYRVRKVSIQKMMYINLGDLTNISEADPEIFSDIDGYKI